MITLEKVGQRIYFVGDTFAAKSEIKALGGHWDGDRRQWWIGVKKQAEAERLVASLNGPAASVGLAQDTPREIVADKLAEEGREEEAAAVRSGQVPSDRPPEDLDRLRVYAQVTYKGRRYYVVAEQRNAEGQPVRCRLTTLDPLPNGPFWADCSACELVRTYEPREGRTRTEYQTIAALRRFRDRQRGNNPRVQCPECGSWHDADEDCRDCGGC